MKKRAIDRIQEAREIFKRHGGAMRTSEAMEAGVHCEVLYSMRDAGMLEKLTRGLYRLVDAPALGNPDLITVALKIPKGVICLISAMSFHNITTQIPHAVDIALARGTEPPRIGYPPIHIYWTVDRIFNCGIEEHKIDGKMIRIYSAERTLVDCFRHRNSIGLDTALEALRLYRERKPLKVDEIMNCARTCRAANIIRPYLEGTL